MNNKYIRHFIAHVICGMIPGQATRRRVRAILKSNWRECIQIIENDIGYRPRNIRRLVGHRGRYLVVTVDDKYVYKFPIRNRNYCEMCMREKKITDAWRYVSLLHIPQMNVINHICTYVRRYEFIRGAQMPDVSPNEIREHIDVLAPQIAQFIYDIAASNPGQIASMRDITAEPGFMRGWFHNDICDNFIFDRRTYKIIAIIDWEDARFMDFSKYFDIPRDAPANELMTAVRREYIRIFG